MWLLCWHGRPACKSSKIISSNCINIGPSGDKKEKSLLSLTFLPNAALWITVGSCSLCTRQVHCAITLGAFGVLCCYVRHAEARFSLGWQAAFSSYNSYNLKKKNKTYLGSWDLVWTPTTASCLHKKWLFEKRQNIHIVVVTANTTITTQNGSILWLLAGHPEVMLWLTASRQLFLHVIKNKTKRPPSLLVPAIELHHKYAPHKRSDGSSRLSEWASGVV